MILNRMNMISGNWRCSYYPTEFGYGRPDDKFLAFHPVCCVLALIVVIVSWRLCIAPAF